MERRNGKRFIPPSENYSLFIGYHKDGMPIDLHGVSETLLRYHDNPEHQAKLAILAIKRSLKEGNAKPDHILSVVNSEAAQNEVRVWCKGNKIHLKEEGSATGESQYGRAKQLLAQDEDLIQKLSPHLRQVDLARLLAVRRYRQADEDTRQTLVYGTYRLLGEVLGPRRRYHYGQEQVVTPVNLPDLPAEIFTDELTRNILLESEMEAALPIFQKSREEGFKYLREKCEQTENPLIKGFITSLEEEYQKGLSLWVPGFRRKIPGSQKDIPDVSEITYSDYPASHQQLYAYRFCHKPESIGQVDLLAGDPRTMKTGAFIYAMRAAGVKTTLVVCPSSLRGNWEREIREKHEEPVEIIRIKSEKEFRRLAKEGVKKRPDYVILSYPLLSRFSSLEAQELFPTFIEKLGVDSLGADEAHLAKEPKTECTKQLYLLSRCLPENAPRIAMTATFVVNSVEDLDEPVRMLLPYRYQNPGDFTRAARNDPHLISALLYGNRLLTRWTKEAILGDKLPPVEGGGPREEPVPFSPFHQQIYDFVHQDNTIEDRLKRGILRQVSLDPLLMLRHYNPVSVQKMIDELRAKIPNESSERRQEILSEKIKALEERIQLVKHLFSPETAIDTLSDAHEKFVQWKLTQNIDEVFDEDFLVKIGYGKLAMWAFFNLPGRLEELVRKSENRYLREDWTGLKGLYSSKYRQLKQDLDKKIASGQEKILIFSGFYQTNVTTGIEDLENIDQDEQIGFMSLYDHLRSWYGDDTILKIDGSVSIEPKRGEVAEREKVRRAFRLDPSRKILLATVRSSRLGIDLTIPPTRANQQFKRLSEIWLDLPDTQADFTQGNGRGQGPGQEIPLEIVVMSATNAEQPETVRYGFIDHGIAESLEYKRLISQMLIDGVPLTDEEENFVKSYMTNLRMDVYPQTPRRYMRERFFVDIRGKGTKKNMEYLEKVGFEGLTNEDFFVTYYSQNDETSLSGHNAKAVAEIFNRFKEISGKRHLRIGSAGSGAGILQATLGDPLINIDMMRSILQVARHRLHERGSFIQADAAHLPIAGEAFDAFDASLMLHWTDNNPLTRDNPETSERALILQELNRITRINGLVSITVPSTYLTSEQFGKWKLSLEKFFGLRARTDLPSGLLRAVDYRPEPLSWIFNLEKIAEPQAGFSLHDLRFDFEQVVSIVSPNKGRGNGNGSISTPLPIPHSEFEIIQPESGKRDELVYKRVVSMADIEEELLGRRKSRSWEPEEIISQLGSEEYGFYRRLRKQARSRWNLGQTDADRFAVEAVQEWYKNGTQKHDSQRILTELGIIMEDLMERKTQK